MKHRIWITLPATLVLALGLVANGLAADAPATTAPTAPAASAPATTEKAPGANKERTASKTPRMDTRLVGQLEEMFGKPLTDEQKQQLQQATEERNAAMRAATEQFTAKVAQMMGVTPAELKAKERALHDKARSDAMKNTAPATPATPAAPAAH